MPSYESLVREYHAFVFRVAFGVLHDRAGAEDVAQDVFLEVLRRPAGIERADNPRAYLARAAVNGALDSRRGERRRARREQVVSRAEAAMGPVEEVFRREVRARVQELPEEERQAVDLHYFQGCTLGETALALDVSDRTISNRLSQALARLKQALGAAGFAALLAGLESELGKCGAEPVPDGLCGRLMGLRTGPLPPALPRRIALTGAFAAAVFIAAFVVIRLRDASPESGESPATATGSGETARATDPAAGPSGSATAGKPAETAATNPAHARTPIEERDVTVRVSNVAGQAMEGVGLRVEFEGSFRSGRTDASGRAFFRFPDLKATVHVLTADADSRRAYFVNREAWDVPPGSSQVDVVVAEKTSVHGIALDAKGQPLMLASVLTSSNGIPCGFGMTDAKGRFVAWVPEDREADLVLTYTAESGVGKTRFTHNARISGVRAGDAELRVQAPALTWGGSLTVRVLAPDGTPAAGASVGIADTWNLTAAAVRAGGAAPLPDFRSTADADGTVVLTGLPDVPLAVQATPDAAHAATWLPDGAVEIQPVGQTLTLRLRSSATISGLALDPDGKPVADALVIARPAGDGQPDVASTRTGPDGRFTLSVPPDAAGPLVLTGFRGQEPTLMGTAEGVLPGSTDVTLRMTTDLK